VQDKTKLATDHYSLTASRTESGAEINDPTLDNLERPLHTLLHYVFSDLITQIKDRPVLSATKM